MPAAMIVKFYVIGEMDGRGAGIAGCKLMVGSGRRHVWQLLFLLCD